MVESEGSEETVDSGILLRLLHDGVAAYNARDIDAWRLLFAPDLVGVDHRPVSLGTFDYEVIIAFTEAMWAETRSSHLAVSTVETRGNVELIRTLETSETLDGAEVSVETLMVEVVVGGRVERQEIFAAEAETHARAVFEKLAACSADQARP